MLSYASMLAHAVNKGWRSWKWNA